jgi:hypothetical protein
VDRYGKFTPEDLETCPELREVYDALMAGWEYHRDRGEVWLGLGRWGPRPVPQADADAEVAAAMAALDEELRTMGG